MRGTQRWALVTGASGTVGGECARALSRAGLGVIVHGRRADAVADVVDELTATGGEAVASAFDIGDPSEIARAVAGFEEDGRMPAVLVNAAADFGPLVPVDGLAPPVWERIFAVNLHGLQALVQTLVPAMRQAGWGRVIQVSSSAALAAPGTGNAAYSVSKAAGNRMLGHLAAELAGSGVTVHAMHPGEIVSRMWEHIRGESAGRDEMAGYADWVAATGVHPDDPARAGELVVRLLDDATAAAAHGTFSWAQDPARAPQPLT
jgi:NAD(P)-dependent dehydrogenase (short-subunit alcohol dehydrogenase family)